MSCVTDMSDHTGEKKRPAKGSNSLHRVTSELVQDTIFQQVDQSIVVEIKVFFFTLSFCVRGRVG